MYIISITYQAFNGRYYGEENKEIIYTVFLSEILIQDTELGDLEDDWLTSLPLCPLCLEKLDISVSGL